MALAQFGTIPKVLRRELPTLLRASYMPLGQAADVLHPRGYEVDTQLSIEGAIVISSEVTGPIVLFRGTTLASDWVRENLPLIVGVDGPRHEAARALVARVEAKYGRPAHAIGHSLGGRLAERSGASGLVLTAGKAAGLADLEPQSNPRQLDVHVDGDPVSALARGGLRERLPVQYTGDQMLAEMERESQLVQRLPEPIKRWIARGLAAHSLENFRH